MSVDFKALLAAQGKGLTVGVVPASGETALRLEIDDFIQDTELANLYFLALEAFMAHKRYQQPFGYYEISGIHGQPARPWDGVTATDVPFPKTSGQVNAGAGYCAHGSVLFPLWHRVYLAQFEQALYLHAASIAPDLLGSQAQAVLDRFRIPYFDPLLPRQKSASTETYKYGIPIIFTVPQIQVRRPGSSTLVPMDNPLYKFSFPQEDVNSNTWNWNGFKTKTHDFVPNAVKLNTMRGYDGTTDSANHSFVIDTFDNNYNPDKGTGTSDPGYLWRVLLDNQNWVTMSNHFDPANRRQKTYNLNSLEGFHDDIHGYFGSGPHSSDNRGNTWPSGHMAIPSYAGFDPVFWLHHCNIDRLLAIWQGIHSRDDDSIAWWTSLENEGGTFVEPALEKETPTTNLAPFRKSIDGRGKVVWWSGTDVRNWTKLGYDYPQTAAARKSGNILPESLVAWANAELGFANPNTPSGPDQGARDKLKSEFQIQVQAFQHPILIDGKTKIDSSEQFISSSTIATGSFRAQAKTLTQQLPQALQQPGQAVLQAIAPQEEEEADPGVASAVSQIIDSNDQTATIISHALPRKLTSTQPLTGPIRALISSQHTMTQWNATFGVDKYAIGAGSFMLYFFVGDFDPSVTSWLHDPHLAGSSFIFATPQQQIDEGQCENCAQKRQHAGKYYDTVGLTQALLTYWKSGEEVHGLKVTSLDAESVIPFLTRNLHWRIVDIHGQNQPRENVPSLKVGVYSESVVLPQQLTEKPRFEHQQMRKEITNGRPGGLNNNEDL